MGETGKGENVGRKLSFWDLAKERVYTRAYSYLLVEIYLKRTSRYKEVLGKIRVCFVGVAWDCFHP